MTDFGAKAKLSSTSRREWLLVPQHSTAHARCRTSEHRPSSSHRSGVAGYSASRIAWSSIDTAFHVTATNTTAPTVRLLTRPTTGSMAPERSSPSGGGAAWSPYGHLTRASIGLTVHVLNGASRGLLVAQLNNSGMPDGERYL